MKQKVFFVILLFAVTAVAGCTQYGQQTQQQNQQADDITLPDGTVQKADGTMIKPDGTMIKPDGTMVKPDGTMVLPNGTMIGPEGSKGEMMEKEGKSIETTFSGTVLAGTSAKLIDFNKADYDAAIASDKIVFLYFYADWCPICRAEVPELYAAFNELSTNRVVGFQVNFKDSGTDNDEKALAGQFQVPYQHTKIILENDAVVLKAPDSWNKKRYLSEINKVLA